MGEHWYTPMWTNTLSLNIHFFHIKYIRCPLLLHRVSVSQNTWETVILRRQNSKAVIEFFGINYFRSEINKACRTKCLSKSKTVWESPRFTDKPVSKSQPYLSYLWLSLLHVLISWKEKLFTWLFKGPNEDHNVLRIQQNCVTTLCSTQGLSDPPPGCWRVPKSAWLPSAISVKS